MPDYQKLYTTLFNKITDIIEELQEVQRLTEELYLQSEENEESTIDRWCFSFTRNSYQ